MNGCPTTLISGADLPDDAPMLNPKIKVFKDLVKGGSFAMRRDYIGLYRGME